MRHLPPLLTNYPDNQFVDEQGDGHMSVNDTVLMARFPGGYFDHTGSPRYYLTDYQGNNVGVLDANGGQRQWMNYYPYGEPWAEWNWSLADVTTMCRNRFLFGDKERMTEYCLNGYDYTARTYHAAIPRFHTPDPHAEKRPGLSPYIFCNSNPVMLIDPSGMEALIFPEDTLLDSDMEVESEEAQEVQQEESGQPVQPDGSAEDKPLSTWDKVNTGASAVGTANGIKVGLIQWATNPKNMNEVQKYLKWFKGLGVICGGVNAFYGVRNIKNYYDAGGTNVWVYVKNIVDIGVGIIPIFISGEAALVIAGGGTLYFMSYSIWQKIHDN